MGLKNSRKRIIYSLFFIIVILIQMNGSIIYNHPPSINHMVIECNDITCVEDLILVGLSWDSTVVRNISKIEKLREFTKDSILESEIVISFYNNGNQTFLGMMGDYSVNRSVIGLFENNDISTLHKIIGSNLSFIHNIKQRGNNLFLFGSRYEIPQCEVYNVSNLYLPSLISCHNISEIDSFSYYPPYYEYEDYLDYQFYKNYLYHSTINNKLLIYDFNNVSAPVRVKEFEENYSRVIFHEELMYGLSENKLQVIDNNNPLNPVKTDSYEIDTPKVLAVNENIVCVITERELILLEKEGNKVVFRDKYELKNRVNLKFKKIIIEKNYALIITESYITGLGDTQTDLFVFEITNRYRINLLYPRIKISLDFYYFLIGYFPYIIIICPIIIVIGAVLVMRYYEKKPMKSEEKKAEPEK